MDAFEAKRPDEASVADGDRGLGSQPLQSVRQAGRDGEALGIGRDSGHNAADRVARQADRDGDGGCGAHVGEEGVSMPSSRMVRNCASVIGRTLSNATASSG